MLVNGGSMKVVKIASTNVMTKLRRRAATSFAPLHRLKTQNIFVMAGLHPGHPRLSCTIVLLPRTKDVDARNKSGNDVVFAVVSFG